MRHTAVHHQGGAHHMVTRARGQEYGSARNVVWRADALGGNVPRQRLPIVAGIAVHLGWKCPRGNSIDTAHFYADHILNKVLGIRDSIVEGAESVTALGLDAF